MKALQVKFQTIALNSMVASTQLETNLTSTGQDVVGFIQRVSPWLMIICIAICGLLFVAGRKGADFAKPWLINIFLGAILIFGAITIGTWFVDTTSF